MKFKLAPEEAFQIEDSYGRALSTCLDNGKLSWKSEYSTYTIFDFGNGDISAFDWLGALDMQKLVDAGIKTNANAVVKQPMNVSIGKQVTSIETSAFSMCTQLKSVQIPSTVSSINDRAFYGCTSLAEVDSSNALSVGQAAFSSCYALSSASMYSLLGISTAGFTGCSSLVDIDFPNVLSIGQNAFDGCQSLQTASFPKATAVGKSSFGNDFSGMGLKTVRLHAVTSIDATAFYNCTQLSAVDLGPASHSSLPALANVNAFYNVPASCMIIVPDAQYDALVAASNWQALHSDGYKFVKWSDCQYAHMADINSLSSALGKKRDLDDLSVTAYELLPLDDSSFKMLNYESGALIETLYRDYSESDLAWKSTPFLGDYWMLKYDESESKWSIMEPGDTATAIAEVAAARDATELTCYITSSMYEGNCRFTRMQDVVAKHDMLALSSEVSSKADISAVEELNAALSLKADAAATLSGYGIEDAKIENGVITLGDQSVQPATAAEVSKKLDLSAAAPVFDEAYAYFANEYVSYDGGLWRFTSQHAPNTPWALSAVVPVDMASPDATLDIMASGALRVMAADGEQLWMQGYNVPDTVQDLAIALSNETLNPFQFAQNTSAALSVTLPSIAAGKVADLILEVCNPALSGDEWSNLSTYSKNDVVVKDNVEWTCSADSGASGAWDSSLWTSTPWPQVKLVDWGTKFSVAVPVDEDIAEWLTIQPGTLADIYFTSTSFKDSVDVDGAVKQLPVWKLARQDSEIVQTGGQA